MASANASSTLLRRTCLASNTPTHPTKLRRTFTSTSRIQADFTHCVIGGGAVGLAVSRRLASVPNTSTLLLEKHRAPGTETSSRNSEVIHAGLYYGHDSLKTSLCLQGKRMLYDLCDKYSIGYKRCGKWIVAQNEEQRAAVNNVHEFAKSLGQVPGSEDLWAPTRWISHDEAKSREPDVRAEAGALESLSTGILDSHGYMTFLLGDFEEIGGTTALGTSVTRIEGLGSPKGSAGWRVYTRDAGAQEGDEDDVIEVETLINSAGLYAVPVSNMVLPESEHRKAYYAKGTYYNYTAPKPKPKTLVYPAPMPGHGGLGTHLTTDMAGQIRFGPDVQWVDSPADLVPNEQGFETALDDIQTYLPGLQRDAVGLDYAGIRPKLTPKGSATSGKGFEDFYIRKEKSVDGFVNLLGIESPGLTSSLAIGEYVHDILYGKVGKNHWGAL